MLLLRILPCLSADSFHVQLLELWTKLLLSMPVIGRRDTIGDNILPKLHPYYKRFFLISNAIVVIITCFFLL